MEEKEPENNQPSGEVNYTQNDPLEAIGYQAEPGDIYYMNPPKQLSTYPMYIDNPRKIDRTVGSYICYTMDGTDVTEQLTRRYSDFFSLYEKLLQRWPGIYIPRIPPKKITGNTTPAVIKTRMRLLNRFCLNLSNIDYLYRAEETNIFRNNVPDVANAINKLPELNYSDMLARMKEAFPEYNENYDIIVGKSKISDFENFLKKCQKNIEEFQNHVTSANEKRETEKRQYMEMIKGFSDYEKNNMMSYVAIKQIYGLLEKEEQLKDKLNTLEEDIKKGQSGQVSFIKGLFKKKEDIIAEIEKEKEVTQQKINDIQTIIRIVGDNMENQIEV